MNNNNSSSTKATKRYYRDMTNYPDVYTCYWGCFEAKMVADDPTYDEIFQNRNRFVEDYNIDLNQPYNKDRTSKVIPNYVYKQTNNGINSYNLHYDHLEYYRLNKTHDTDRVSWIVVNSPYSIQNDDDKQQLINDGWTEIYKLYHPRAETFIKIIQSTIPNRKTVQEE
jgi:hypothetical protein